jgi:hypothetical protein
MSGVTGDVLLLPFNSYRRPTWNDRRRTLDPVGRYLTPNYLGSDVLFVSGSEIAGEDERAARVARLLAADLEVDELARALGQEGIAWVVQDKEAQQMVGDAAPSADLTGLPVVHDGPTLIVWELPEPDPAEPSTVTKVVLTIAWVAAMGTVALGGALALIRLSGRRRNAVREQRR